MNIQEIYERYDKIGAFTFATIEDGRPRTRIAHLFAYDDEGLYFRTMTVKPFYAQLKKTEKVAISGMYPNSSVSHDENGMPEWEPGYTVNLTGDVREVSLDVLKQKAEGRPMFELGVKDIERYPALTTFCIHRGFGEVYDFDFEKKNRPDKLIRIPLSFGGIDMPFRGIRISDNCVGCGSCIEGCTFNAISVDDDVYKINHSKCDACGDCYTVCPVDAIDVVNEG
ncbi:MAG: ferredoxin [Desulforhopalus sp.]|jgi:ferredoxin